LRIENCGWGEEDLTAKAAKGAKTDEGGLRIADCELGMGQCGLGMGLRIAGGVTRLVQFRAYGPEKEGDRAKEMNKVKSLLASKRTKSSRLRNSYADCV
jgi:hypothetical protein